MKLLFKINNPGNPAATVAESGVKNYVASIHRRMAWATLEPFINPATREYLIPHIGRSFYDEIANKFNSGTIEVAEQEALELMQRVIAYGLSLDFAQEMNINLTDMGPQQNSDKEGTSNSPSQWAFATKNWNTLRKMDKYLDQLLQHLDEQVKNEVSNFSTYANSREYAAEGSDFFKSVEELDEYLNIEGSRRAFSRITKYFRKAERRYILPILGQAFYDELQTAYAAGNTTAEQQTAIQHVQRCVAEFGAYEAIPHISAVWQNNGIVIVSKADGFNSRAISNTLFGQAMIERVQARTEKDGETERRELKSYLFTQADSFPTYKNSDAFPDESSDSDVYGGEDGAVLL